MWLWLVIWKFCILIDSCFALTTNYLYPPLAPMTHMHKILVHLQSAEAYYGKFFTYVGFITVSCHALLLLLCSVSLLFFGRISLLFCFVFVHFTPVLVCTFLIGSLCILIDVHLNVSGLWVGLAIWSAQVSGPVTRHGLCWDCHRCCVRAVKCDTITWLGITCTDREGFKVVLTASTQCARFGMAPDNLHERSILGRDQELLCCHA